MIEKGMPDPKCRDGRLSYGLMSLSEMINCSISGLVALCSQLMLEQATRSERIIVPEVAVAPISEKQKNKMRGWLTIATSIADEFEWSAVRDRIEIITKKLNRPMSNRDLATEVRVLRETIEAGSKMQLIYRYPNEQGAILLKWKTEWASVLGSFGSAASDVHAAVDLWSLGHSTASVFHLMRVLEHGLRALAADVGKSFDIQNWQNIIDEIETEIRAQGKTLPRGIAKTERLQFLSEAAKEFMYFKDGWRNYVAHNRATYDNHQARSVLEHVKAFMTVLSSKLKEQSCTL